MHTEIGLNQCGSLRIKVDTGVSGNVMQLKVFAKLFPRCITRDGKPTGLYPIDTRMMAHNGSNIQQFGALDTATEWTPKGHQDSKHVQTRWYVADSLGPAMLNLPSSSKLGIVQLTCMVKLTSTCDPPAHPRNLQQSMLRSGATSFLHSWIPWNLSHHSHNDAKPVVHASRKCPIAMWPLVHEKLDEFINQSITVPVKEPTDWVSSLAYSWKANGKLQVCLDQMILIQLLDMITTKPLMWKRSPINWLEAPGSPS